MFEKVNPSHPDKIADRIAGAIVDLAYKKNDNPKVAVEVLIGHGHCHIINETSEKFTDLEIRDIVRRIAGQVIVTYSEYEQDKNLAKNQEGKLRCGDNGIFRGVVISNEEKHLAEIAKVIYWKYAKDGKYIIDDEVLIICQSCAYRDEIEQIFPKASINPLGFWTGGLDVDTGATNRKLGSDMGRAVTGGGLHGKDLSKADVSINVYLHKLAQNLRIDVHSVCAIGDTVIDIYDNNEEFVKEVPYQEIVDEAYDYIVGEGGFEKLAEWGLIK